MTPDQAKTLRQPYRWDDLKHPEGMNYSFMQFLDDVRYNYGWPMAVTSDFRSPVENAAASGSSPSSRHLAGEAVDFEFPPTANHLWLLVDAIFKCRRAQPIELEIVWGPADRHIHLAFLTPGQASRIEIATD